MKNYPPGHWEGGCIDQSEESIRRIDQSEEGSISSRRGHQSFMILSDVTTPNQLSFPSREQNLNIPKPIKFLKYVYSS